MNYTLKELEEYLDYNNILSREYNNKIYTLKNPVGKCINVDIKIDDDTQICVVYHNTAYQSDIMTTVVKSIFFEWLVKHRRHNISKIYNEL